jgi:glycosyltransferase involved in cell wall biosynthesis
MNVVLAIQSLEVGGTERQVVELAIGLKKRNHQVCICCLNRFGSLAEEAIKYGVSVVCLNKRFRYDLRVILRLAAYLRETNADILQTFLFGADLWGRFAGRLARVKVILTSDRAGGLVGDLIERWTLKLFWKLSDGVVSNTCAGARAVSTMSGLGKDRVHVVFNGIRTERFSVHVDRNQLRRMHNYQPGQFVVGIVGGLKRIKNHEMFLRVAYELSTVRSRCTFLVIGVGPEQSRLQSLAKQFGITENTRFLGPYNNVAEILPACDVGVLCSRWEGFPNSIMEYMACGLPVVATDVGGVSELVQSGVTGFLVQPDAVAQMAQKILWLQRNREESIRMGIRAKSWLEENCGVGILAQKTEAIYKSTLSAKGYPSESI